MVAAIFAAYVLMLQGLLGALASGQHVGDMIVDRQIHLSLCDPASSGSLPPTGDHQTQMPPCCAQGCTMAMAQSDVPPAIATRVAYETVSLVDREPRTPIHAVAPVDESSGRPRAPPHHLRTI